eukprot:scaffold34194_cov16-Tisochrysis_lutea.AAC.1
MEMPVGIAVLLRHHPHQVHAQLATGIALLLLHHPHQVHAQLAARGCVEGTQDHHAAARSCTPAASPAVECMEGMAVGSGGATRQARADACSRRVEE